MPSPSGLLLHREYHYPPVLCSADYTDHLSVGGITLLHGIGTDRANNHKDYMDLSYSVAVWQDGVLLCLLVHYLQDLATAE